MVAPVPSPLGSALPLVRNQFVGRDAERLAARAFLIDDAVALLTLTGPGGVGKTRLALAIARDLTPHFADGVLFVDLAPLVDQRFVATAVAAALGITAEADQAMADAIGHHLRQRQLLLILDNCEHVLTASADLVSMLLSRCPALQMLATSRSALHVHGEQVLPVAPLALPAVGSPAEWVRAAPATALFIERARTADPLFRLTSENADMVAAVCQRLDGLPLAIELAAARTTVLSPAALLALLDQRMRVLATGPRNAPARHQTIQAAISWSYDLLAPAEQAFFRHLAVFAGGWTLAAAAAVGNRDLSAALDGLEALVDQSLVLRSSDANAVTPRFAMLETIRAFGLERLAEHGEEVDARDRHAAFFRHFVNDLDLYAAFPADKSWFSKVAPEEGNFRLALEHVNHRGDSLALSELCSGLEPFWLTRSQFAEGRLWVDCAIAQDDGLPAFLRARNRASSGVFLWYHGEVDLALHILAEAVTLARASGEPFPLEQALQAYGHVMLQRGEFAQAMAAYEEAEQAARAFLPLIPHGALFVGAELCFQGATAKRKGDWDTAVARFTEAIPFLRAPGGGRRLGMLLTELGVIQVMTGNVTEGSQSLVEALALTWEARNDLTLSGALRGLAAVASVTGQPISAAQLLGAADTNDAGALSPTRAQTRDRAIVDWCRARLADRLDEDALRREHHIGTNLTVEQGVSLARAVTIPVLGAARVDEIWQATEASDPGHPLAAPLGGRSREYGQEPSLWNLTRREREVLTLLCQHLTDAEIAQTLFVSIRTASGHVANILSKLGAANRREAASIAARLGHV